MANQEWSFEVCVHQARARKGIQAEGLYGPTSAMWLIMRENMAVMGGLGAVLLQLTHPAIAAAGAHGSKMKSDPNGRARRTFAAMYEIIFGDLTTAAETAGRIHRIHEKIKGEFAGQTYGATDPSLQFWVLATLIDSSIRTYELIVGPLTLRDRQDYYADMRLFGVTMGIPADFMPETWEDFVKYFDEMINGDLLCVSEPGRKFAAFLLSNSAARWTGSAALVTGMLPRRWREKYGLPWGPKERARFVFAIRMMRMGRRLMPPSLRYCPAYHQALLRLGAAPGDSRTWAAGAIIRFSRILRLPWALAPTASR